MLRLFLFLPLAAGCDAADREAPDAGATDAPDCPVISAWAKEQNVLLGSGTRYVAAVVADESDVFWTEELWNCLECAGGMVFRLPLAGGEPAMLLHTWNHTDQLSLTDTTLFIHDGSRMVVLPREGGTPVEVSTRATAGPATEPDVAFFFESDQQSRPGRLVRVDPDGRHLKSIATFDQPMSNLRANGASLFWISSPASDDPSDIWRAPVAGGEPVLLAHLSKRAGQASGPLAMNGEAIFVALREPADRATFSIVRVSLDGGGVTVLAESQPGFVGTMLADENHVYWTSEQRLSRVPVGGGCVESRSDDSELGTDLALTDRGIVQVGSNVELIPK